MPPLEGFYIVKLASMDTAPTWADYILDVRADGPDVVVREVQIAPLSRFCADDVTVKAVEKVLPHTTPLQLTQGLNLCSPALRQQVVSSLQKYSSRQAVTISHSQRYGIVANCGHDTQAFDLPYPEALNQKKLRGHARQPNALFSLFDRLHAEVFGTESLFPAVAIVSDPADLSLQQTGAKLVGDLKSGQFDRGFGGRNCRGLNSGCEENPVQALLKNYKGPISSPVGAQVRLLDRSRLPLIRYVAPDYPAAAISALLQDRLPLEIEISPSGKVINVTVLGGDAALRESAVTAARQWEFRPGSERFLQMTLDYFFQCP